MTFWQRKVLSFYGISVFLTSFPLPTGAGPCQSYCCSWSQSSCSLGRYTSASCKQTRGERSQWHGQSYTARGTSRRLLLSQLCGSCCCSCVSSNPVWLQTQRGFCQVFSSLYNTKCFCHIFSWGEVCSPSCVSVSILPCHSGYNDHSLINK